MPGLVPIALALALAAPAPGRADDGRASIPSDPAFTATLVDGSTASGRIRRLGAKDGVTLVEGEEADKATTIPIDRLVKLTREGASPPPRNEGGGLLLFPEGDRLARCRIGASVDGKLDVHSVALEGLGVPTDAMVGLIFEAPTDPEALDLLVARVRSEPRDSEILWLKNGDKLPGLLAGLDAKKVKFKPSNGQVELDRESVSAIGFDPATVEYRRPAGPFFELTMVDGSRLGVAEARFERGQVAGKARFGAEVRVPVGELARVHVMDGPVVYLSAREPDRFVYEPYIGPTRPHRLDSCVNGRPLKLGGRVYDRGIGTQSRTLLLYKLAPGSKRFQALVGLDDSAGPLGNVGFKVIVDGKVRFEFPAMGAGDGPRPVDVDVSGAKLLVLITEFGERGDVQDGADWVEARIVR